MAAAEVRAAWQRTANRCFVQEDAKRAPKLACCQPSGSAKPVDSGPTSEADEADHPLAGFMPYSRNRSYSDLPPDMKWWLHMQPNYGHQRCFAYEQLNTLDVDAEAFESYIRSMSSEAGGVGKWTEDITSGYQMMNPCFDRHIKGSTMTSLEVKSEELKPGNGKTEPDILEMKELTDYYESMEKESVGSLFSKQSVELSLEGESAYLAAEKVPWWQKADRDDMASLVAKKSHVHIENCDLPPLQKPHDKQGGFPRQDDISPDSTAQSNAISGLSNKNSATFRTQWASAKGGSENAAHNFLSLNCHDRTSKAIFYDRDPSKAQLMEALCHSQTRAREAENAAKQAYTEKEHILKLLFKQASHLLAYKQWFRLLQLESFLHQIQDKGSGFPATFPASLPWMMPCKPVKLHRRWNKAVKSKRQKQGSPGFNIGKYCIAFLGLSIVGAGLFLGWTLSWMQNLSG
ncbi:hypothetical protein Droror1_Dr00027491 [Drosera rotundifolia]